MRAVLSILARALGVVVVFAAALALGVVLHIDTPAARRAVVERVNAALAPLFAGRLTIENLGGVGLTRLDGIDARVDDPDGKLVIHAAGVAGHVSTWVLLRGLFRGEIDIEVPKIELVHGEVNLDEDAGGTLRIARAFALRGPSTPGPPGPPVHLLLPRVHLDHVEVRGRMSGVPPIDADLDDADGSLSLPSTRPIRVDIARARWVARDVIGGQGGSGEAEGHLAVPSPQGGAFSLRIATRATLGTLAAQADATYDGGHVDAVVDVPSATPEQVRALLPVWPITEAGSVHAEVHGALPQLAVKAHAAFGAAVLDVGGPVTVAPRLQASLHIDGKNLDARALGPSEPSTSLAAVGDVTIDTKPTGTLEGHAALDVAAGRIGSLRIPAAGLNGEVTRAPGGEIRGSAKIAIHEPGAPTLVTARFTPKSGSVAIAFQAEVNAPDLSRIPRLRTLRAASGRVLAQADGSIDLGAGTIAARLAVATEGFEVPGVTVKAAHVEILANGPLSDPSLNVQVAGEDLDVWRLQCSTVEASARVGVVGGLTFEDVALSARASDQEAQARARLVRIDGDRVSVEGATVDGFGAPVEGTVRFAPGSLYVRVRSGDLGLDRIARFLRVDDVRGGELTLDVDATVGGGAADGKVDVDVSRASFAGFDDTSAHVQATLHGRQAAGHGTVRLADIGSVEVQSRSVELGPGRVLSAVAWRRAWGAIDVLAHVDLPKLAAHVPARLLPATLTAGTLDATARVERDSSSDATPAVDATASTSGLRLTGGNGITGWRLEGLDPRVHVVVDGETGGTAVEAEINDAKGSLVTVDAASRAVPFANLLEGGGVVAALRAMPVDARLEVPSRTLESLPPILGLTDLHGEVQAGAEWHGPLDKPSLHATVSLRRGLADPTMATLPVDAMATLDYDGAHATAKIEALDRDKVVVDASGTADVKVRDVLDAPAGGSFPWTASARAKANGFSLRAFQGLSDRQVRGKVDGEFVLERLHDDARASAKFALENFAVGEVTTRNVHVQASLDGHTFDGALHVEQTDEGFLNARAHAGMHWGSAVLPVIDAAKPADVEMTATKLRAALLLPFVSNVFTELDGRIDGDAIVMVDPAQLTAQAKGQIALKDGTFELTSLGGEFGDVAGKLVLTPDGVFKIEDFVAHGVTGRVEAAATGRLAGLALEGLRATVQVPKKEPIPVVFDGVQVGTLDGHLDVDVARAADHKGLNVAVAAPTLRMELPSTGTHDVQPLGNLENVKTGIVGASGFVDVPLDYAVDLGPPGPPRAPIKITIRLGKEVEVVRGANLDVHLQGEPVVTIADDVQVRGQIRLVRGSIDVNGKPFEIENGTVTFDGDDPSNPQVVVTAMWTARDAAGTRVYADFVGPLKTGKVTLRSDPPLPGGQNEIRSLILFGTSDDTSSVGTASNFSQTTQAGQSNQGTNQTLAVAAPALGAAGGLAAQPINAALGGLNRALTNFGLGGGITARVDTSQVNPRPEVELQIARDISVQVSWLIGTPVPGSNPDVTLVTLNWRFLRTWAVEATRGDQGTSILDLVWQHRY